MVLQAMVETGAITRSGRRGARPDGHAAHAARDAARHQLLPRHGGGGRPAASPSPGDLTLRTTLNLELQRLAEGVIERRLEAEGGKKKVAQAALVALRKDGAILAMVGGRDYEDSQFNRAIQARRQPGSLFKLFVYLTAFQQGYTPRAVLVDRPIQIGDWEPQNQAAASAARCPCAPPSRSRSTPSRPSSPTRSASPP